jgi:hypothetical protein
VKTKRKSQKEEKAKQLKNKVDNSDEFRSFLM